MHLNLEGRHLSITPALNAYVKTKLKKVKAHFEHIIHAHIVLETIKGVHRAEATITVQHRHFHNQVKSEDMYKSIDFLFDKIERQVRRYKEHLQDKGRRKKNNQAEQQWQQAQEASEREEKNLLKITTVQPANKPMNHLEAILQLRLEEEKQLLCYFADSKKTHPCFLRKVTAENYHLFNYEAGLWEKSLLELVSASKVQINQIHHLRPSTEAIEDAVDFLLHNPEQHRFFISLRTGRSMLLYKNQEKHFTLLHS